MRNPVYLHGIMLSATAFLLLGSVACSPENSPQPPISESPTPENSPQPPISESPTPENSPSGGFKDSKNEAHCAFGDGADGCP